MGTKPLGGGGNRTNPSHLGAKSPYGCVCNCPAEPDNQSVLIQELKSDLLQEGLSLLDREHILWFTPQIYNYYYYDRFYLRIFESYSELNAANARV